MHIPRTELFTGFTSILLLGQYTVLAYSPVYERMAYAEPAYDLPGGNVFERSLDGFETDLEIRSASFDDGFGNLVTRDTNQFGEISVLRRRHPVCPNDITPKLLVTAMCSCMVIGGALVALGVCLNQRGSRENHYQIAEGDNNPNINKGNKMKGQETKKGGKRSNYEYDFGF